jgi:arsenite methyltransferase
LIYNAGQGDVWWVSEHEGKVRMGEEPKSDEVRRRYAAIAVSVREGSSCCGSDAGGALDSEERGVDWTGGSYSEVEKRELPQAAVEFSLGCGNPVALATLSSGEVVLDLGSGGGVEGR